MGDRGGGGDEAQGGGQDIHKDRQKRLLGFGHPTHNNNYKNGEEEEEEEQEGAGVGGTPSKRHKLDEEDENNNNNRKNFKSKNNNRRSIHPPLGASDHPSTSGQASGTPAPPSESFDALSLRPTEEGGGGEGGNSGEAEGKQQQGSCMAGKLHDAADDAAPTHAPMEGERVGSRRGIRKVEYIRLLEQALYSLGYTTAAAQLEEDSRVPFETGDVAALRAAVLAGQWDESSRILRSLAGTSALTPALVRQAEFLLQQEKFLEYLSASDTASALSQLRLHLAPLCTDRRRLHQLASWLMCPSKDDLLLRSGWSGQGTTSRVNLMRELQALLPPTLMIPERRLESIVEQALSRQEADCTYHNYGLDSLTLFADHDCGRTQIPSVTTQVLDEHTDEVWHVQFSHDGYRLATASKDCRAIIWQIPDEFSSTVQHILVGHSSYLSFVSWSPNDSMIVTCSNDHLVKLWSTVTGACLHTYSKHNNAVAACAWFPCGRRFVSVGNVKSVSGHTDRSLYVWDIDGNEIPDWLNQDGSLPAHLQGARINDVAISFDGRFMVTISSESEIAIHCLETGAVRIVSETRSVTSLSMSLDSHYALVNISNGFIHLWDLEAICRHHDPVDKPSFQYKGQVQGRFVIRSCFGGSHQSFIASGSEDCQVYIWHRPTGELLHVLPGHAGTVNAVTWPASRPLMFATASDDRTVRIWGLADAKASPQWHTSANGLKH